MAENFNKGDKVRVDMKRVHGPEPYLKLVRRVIQKALREPVVMSETPENVFIAETTMSALVVGAVMVPKEAVERI